MKNFYYIFFLLFTFGGLQAQLETTHWYFGYNAGLDFTTGISEYDPNGLTQVREGTASMSDECGNLLFYTTGDRVYTRNHNAVMPNGYPLFGHGSSAQSAIIIPNPEDSNIFYIFTVDGVVLDHNFPENRGMHYSIVDMSQNGGDGVVTERNIPLPLNGVQKSSEKLAAVENADGTGYWVVTQFTDSFYAFEVTATGVNPNPIISTIGVHIESDGYMENGDAKEVDRSGLKISPDGSKIAVAYSIAKGSIAGSNSGAWAVYKFNNATGAVSDPYVEVGRSSKIPYSVEFSPNSNVLYLSYYQVAVPKITGLLQYDLTAPSILDSEYVISTRSQINDSRTYGTLQLGLDDKIYMANFNSRLISIIHDPNQIYNPVTGENPNFEEEGILSPSTLGNIFLGLPNFVSSFFTKGIYFNGQLLVNGNAEGEAKYCFGDALIFTPDICGLTVETYEWDFGDGTTSTEQNPTHTYADVGTYTITLVVTAPGGQSNTFTLELEVVPPPNAEDAELKECPNLETGEAIFDLTESYPEINPNGEENLNYTFHLSEQEAMDNENAQSLNYSTTSSTTLWVRVESEWGCVTIVQLELTLDPIPEFTVETPDPVCAGNSATLEITTDVENTVNWYGSQTSTTPIFTGNPFTTPELTETTTYWVEAVSEEGCPSERIELIVEVTDEIIPEFEPIEPICYGETFTLPTESNNGITGSWTPAINNEETTIYTFTPEDGQCSAEYEMTVEIVPIPELNLPEIPDICFGETVTIAVATTGEIVNWYESEFDTEPFHTGETYTTPPLSNSLTLWLEAIDGNCTSTREPITITVNELPAIEAEIPDPVCVGNTVELSVITNGNTVNWYESETSTTPIFTGNPFITPPLNNSTTYYVEAVSDENCKSERIPIEAVITEEIIPEFNQIEPVCFGETFTLPTVSNNGITGIWMPEINNTETTTYTFIPNEGQCSAENVTMTVEIVPIPELQLPEVDFEGCIGESLSLTITATGETVNWYENEFDTEPFHTGETYTTLPLSSSLTLWLEAQTGNCRSERQPITIIAHPIPEMEDLDDIIICDGDSYEFTAPQGFDYYQWSDPNGNIISTEAIVTLTTSGSYQLMAGYEDNPCPVYRNLTVSFSQTPTITEIKSTENTLTVYANGIGPFEYSLDNVFWQSSNIFYNLEPGIYFVYVRDLHGCGTSARQGAIMGVPNFISPNGDGKNDAWQIKALEAYPNTRLQVFDRYGKQFLDRILNSDFEWDGRYNGQPLPSGSYWYIITLESGEKLSGHISIRN